MILDEYVLLPEFRLAFLEIFLLFLELLLLVLEGLLYLVHGTALFEESRRRRHTVQLQMLRQFDFLVHLKIKYILLYE